MKDLELKGVWIPKDILLNKELNDKEKIVLSIILILSTELNYCFVTNRYLSKILNITINRASKIISSLKEKEYITVKIIYDLETQEIKSRELRLTDKLLRGIVKNNNTYVPNQQYPIVKNDKDIINKYKKIYKYNYKQNFEQRKYTKKELEKLYMNF